MQKPKYITTAELIEYLKKQYGRLEIITVRSGIPYSTLIRLLRGDRGTSDARYAALLELYNEEKLKEIRRYNGQTRSD